jgi:hypothetical protein
MCHGTPGNMGRYVDDYREHGVLSVPFSRSRGWDMETVGLTPLVMSAYVKALAFVSDNLDLSDEERFKVPSLLRKFVTSLVNRGETDPGTIAYAAFGKAMAALQLARSGARIFATSSSDVANEADLAREANPTDKNV